MVNHGGTAYFRDQQVSTGFPVLPVNLITLTVRADGRLPLQDDRSVLRRCINCLRRLGSLSVQMIGSERRHGVTVGIRKGKSHRVIPVSGKSSKVPVINSHKLVCAA